MATIVDQLEQMFKHNETDLVLRTQKLLKRKGWSDDEISDVIFEALKRNYDDRGFRIKTFRRIERSQR